MAKTAQLSPVLPDRILGMTEEEQIERIRSEKGKWGKKLVILGHHYQREAIVYLSDFRGDSFDLSQKAASQKEAYFIVFCGVHFMAESARILAAPKQRVFLPNLTAGCPMADMAELDDVEVAWQVLEDELGSGEVIPITYMNSSAAIKAFCGAHGGAVCTSSNAGRVFAWALEANKRILFLPDEHLGRNTANARGIAKAAQALWDRKKPRGGLAPRALNEARVILWKGFCHVHTHFSKEHVNRMGELHPEARIIVHPECKEEVVRLADASGSTRYIVEYVEKAPAGSAIVIGTEVNLVSRLAHENPKKTVLPLSRSLCHNMYKIDPGVLLYTLENLGESSEGVNEILIDEEVAKNARKALRKMLELA
jgi:quinolinate synthase